MHESTHKRCVAALNITLLSLKIAKFVLGNLDKTVSLLLEELLSQYY